MRVVAVGEMSVYKYSVPMRAFWDRNQSGIDHLDHSARGERERANQNCVNNNRLICGHNGALACDRDYIRCVFNC